MGAKNLRNGCPHLKNQRLQLAMFTVSKLHLTAAAGVQKSLKPEVSKVISKTGSYDTAATAMPLEA